MQRDDNNNNNKWWLSWRFVWGYSRYKQVCVCHIIYKRCFVENKFVRNSPSAKMDNFSHANLKKKIDHNQIVGILRHSISGPRTSLRTSFTGQFNCYVCDTRMIDGQVEESSNNFLSLSPNDKLFSQLS